MSIRDDLAIIVNDSGLRCYDERDVALLDALTAYIERKLRDTRS